MKRWLARIALSLVAIVVLCLGVIWWASEQDLNKLYEPVPSTVLPATDPASIVEGERLARIFGCYAGCHGDRMEGTVLAEMPDGSRLVAPNLTQLARTYTPADFEAVVRQGLKPDRRSLMAMPSPKFATMSDEDLSKLLGYILQHEPEDNDPGNIRLMPIARYMIATGKFPMQATLMIPGRVPATNEELANPMRLGRYLALNVCGDCHGLDLGGKGTFAPSLLIAQAYSVEEFTKLMRHGTGLGGRELEKMGEGARLAFRFLTDEEINALHAFLVATSLPLQD